MGTKSICVVHLVRANNGLLPFRRFMESYELNRGDFPHDFLLVCKGFRGRIHPEYARILGRTPHLSLFVRDFGFDIGPYFSAAKRFPHKYFCFLNSFSVILDGKWLEKMVSHVTKAGVGLVGATGSYESPLTNYLLEHRDVSLYRHLVPKVYSLRLKRLFDPFPNRHIRTNGFMISREVMQRIVLKPILTKMDAYRFESGKESLSKQVLGLGKELIVVGRDGKGYEAAQWPLSRTFRQGDQDNLLIEDNKTKKYMESSPRERERLGRLAWGDMACPLP